MWIRGVNCNCVGVWEGKGDILAFWWWMWMWMLELEAVYTVVGQVVGCIIGVVVTNSCLIHKVSRKASIGATLCFNFFLIMISYI